MLPETWSKQENARIQKALISDSLMPLNLVRTINWRVPGWATWGALAASGFKSAYMRL